MADMIKIKLVKQPDLHAGKAQGDRARPGAEEDQPGRGAAGHARVSRHGGEDSAPAGDRGIGSIKGNDMNLSDLKAAGRTEAQEAAYRPGYGLAAAVNTPAAAHKGAKSVSGYSHDARL